MAKVQESSSHEVNTIVEGTKVTGDIEAEKSIRIVGTLEGNLSTKGRAIIGKTGKVVGNILCQDCDIEGEVTGQIIVRGLLSVRPTGIVNSKTFTKQLSVEPGAILNGPIDMSGTNLQSNSNHGSEKKQKASS